MSTYTKEKLSDSVDGKLIVVTGTARGAGTDVHTAGAGSVKDEIWIYATNVNSAAVNLTIEWGNENSATAEITQSIPGISGLTLIIPGLILTNGERVNAYASIASKILLGGFANRVT